MNPRTGLALRLCGPLIEIACLILLKREGMGARSLFGLPVAYLLYAGLALGLLMVLAGLTLVRPATAARPRGPGRAGEEDLSNGPE